MVFHNSLTHFAEKPHMPGADLSGRCFREFARSSKERVPSRLALSIRVRVGYFVVFSSRYAGYRAGGMSSSLSFVNLFIASMLSSHSFDSKTFEK